MCKEKVLFWCQYLDCDLNHYSSNLTVCPSTLIDLLKRFYSFYPTSFHLPFIGSYPSLQGNKGITVTFQLHLPHGRKERKQQCKVRFDKIISTSININTDNVALQSFTPFWKAKKRDTRHQSAWSLTAKFEFINHDLSLQLKGKAKEALQGEKCHYPSLFEIYISDLKIRYKQAMRRQIEQSTTLASGRDSYKLTCMIVISMTCNNLHWYPRNRTIKGVQLTTPYLAMLTLF